MTTTSHDDTPADPTLAEALRVYEAHPLRDGDVVMLLDDRVCLELEQLAAEWDEQLKANTGRVLRETASRVVIAVSRRGARLRPADYQLWRDVHAELRGTDVDLQPVRALPAA